ncbi:cytochrome c oxidase assembly protein [Saccharopolyspora sp. ID03-671]|uniref:cytochrome c oxidase assembly protein n=1 Tax=Saccharopolyspora sp. ID03-671 TaxID=3073066 RepID=UPI0032521DB3
MTERGALLGLPDPGPVTQLALPTTRVLMDLSAASTVGLLLAAAMLAPRRNTASERWLLSPHAYRWVRAAGWTSLAWLLSAVLGVVYTVSDILGQPVGRFATSTAAWTIALDLEPVQVLLWVVAASAVLVVGCRAVLSVRGAAMLFVLAILGTLPPAFGGHSAGSGNHQLAVSGMLLHVIGVVVWTGGLLALLLSWQLSTSDLGRSVHRYSRLAGWCLPVVALSGAVNLVARLGLTSALWESSYGLLVVAKILALGMLGGLGFLHRQRTIPTLDRGRRGLFARLASVEIVVFAATIGLAVGLTRTPPPATGAPETDRATELLGFPMPGPPDVKSLLVDWLPEPIFLAAAAVGIGLYLAAVRRLVHRGESWPVSQTAVWITGWGVIVLLTNGGLARYGYVLFSAHLVQHLALAIVAPALLLLGRPTALASRALPATSDPRWPGPHEWLHSTMQWPPMRFLLRPDVALAIQVAVLAAMYFGGFYEFALRSHAAHLTMSLLVPATGYVFLSSINGADATHRLRGGYRIALLAAYVAVPALLGLALLHSQASIGESWFAALRRPWGGTALADQQLAGSIALLAGATAALVVVIALLVTQRRRLVPCVRNSL